MFYFSRLFEILKCLQCHCSTHCHSGDQQQSHVPRERRHRVCFPLTGAYLSDVTSFPNATGAYELDLSLSSNFSAMWREMHVKTDVFCAGSLILPDKAGRQINVGGWSLESTFGVRLFTPDGRPGVNSTNDWEEDFHVLSLQVSFTVRPCYIH